MLSTIIIHAHWSIERRRLVDAIRRELPAAQLLVDERRIGDHRIANRRGCWPMAKLAWSAELLGATHRLVLEDDAVLCDGFAELAAAAIAERPDAALSLFRGSRSCSVATVLPAAVIAPWLAWASSGGEERVRPHHDQLIELGMAALGVTHLYTEPSIVEHAGVASLLDHPPVRATHFEQTPTAIRLEP